MSAPAIVPNRNGTIPLVDIYFDGIHTLRQRWWDANHHTPHLKFSPGICPVGRAAGYQLHSLESHRRSCRVQGPYQPGDFEFMIQKSNLLPHPFSTWCDLVVPPSSIPGKKLNLSWIRRRSFDEPFCSEPSRRPRAPGKRLQIMGEN